MRRGTHGSQPGTGDPCSAVLFRQTTLGAPKNLATSYSGGGVDRRLHAIAFQAAARYRRATPRLRDIAELGTFNTCLLNALSLEDPTIPYSWRCPFCGHNATIGNANETIGLTAFNDGNRYGPQAVIVRATTCPNAKCREYSLHVLVSDYVFSPRDGTNQASEKANYAWQLVPAAEMKVLPAYVPDPIVADYREACLTRDSSPKAAATLARRCLQGMIRDFWGVSKNRLVDEIEAIRDKVHPLTWDAIDAVRNIGNIGAHMERDINVIVDVEPEEAKLLIGLIETLVDDWYITRHERQQRLTKLVAIAEEKKQMKAQASSGDVKQGAS